MFGSPNPFGQTPSNPFGSSGFGQTAAPANNPFAPKPFGSPTPFGSQTGSSFFGGTSTGMFGAPQASSPFPSTTTFGAASSPAFGGSSTPAFGSSPSTFGGSSAFGQKPAFGGFGSSTTPTPFGSTNQQSQPAFGSSVFGSATPFGAASQSGFGATSTPAFGTTSTPAFGSTSTPAFGAASTPSFGATSTPAFGSTASPAFGSTGSAFGVSNTPAFGAGAAFGAANTSVFGQSTPTFGAPSSAAFGAASSPAFGGSSTQTFGASSSPSFSFASNSAFGQSTSSFGSSPFGAQSSGFGAQATTPTFGSSGFGQTQFGAQKGGSRAVPYTTTADTESTGAGGQPGKLESISAMPAYKEKSHEELRWEDYQSGDKGGPITSGQPSAGINFTQPAAQANPFASASTFPQPSANPFSASTSTNPFAPKPFAQQPTTTFNSSSLGTSTTANPFQSTSFPSTSTGGFGTTSPSLFGGTSSTSNFSSSPSLFTTTAQGTTSAFPSTGFPSSSSIFQSATPSLGQTGSLFGQTGSSFAPTNMFNTPATSQSGSLFQNTPSLFPSTNTGGFGQPPTANSFYVQASNATPFQQSQPGFLNFGGAQSAGTSGFTGASGQNIYGQQPVAQNSVGVLQVPVTNPFGSLPAMPQISIARAGTTPSVQYGISSLPVVDKPAPVRASSLLTSRHLLQRRMKMPARKYYPKHDGPKVPFFCDEEESSSTPKADALFVPRENPRALVIRPVDQWPSRANADKASPIKDVNQNGKFLTPPSSLPLTDECSYPGNVFEAMDGEGVPSINGTRPNGKAKNPAENGIGSKDVKLDQKLNGVHEDHSSQKDESYMRFSGHRAGEAAIVYEHGADIEALMPKLRRADYYTEPRIQELAAKERAEPGFCRRVKDFVVGRRGFGSIKFLDETDVRRLDLDSLVHFNNREVIVYMDEHQEKPPVGQGLNKPAEVTLLNIKCVDKKTKKEFTEGKRVERYKETLKKKTEDQDAEFLSYDAVKGEWKFRVKHFSCYKLLEDDEDEEEEEEDRLCL
ncbi:Nuclear pore complex protein NUP98A [Linum grandiflorum]